MTRISRLPFMATMIAVTSLALVVLGTQAFAAENEFTPYFTNTAPPALIDTGVSAVDVAQENAPSPEGLNEIMPAAGNATKTEANTDADAAITPETSSGQPETE